jgi:hypothetical protein
MYTLRAALSRLIFTVSAVFLYQYRVVMLAGILMAA